MTTVLKNLSYKTKNKLLLAVIALFTIIVYSASVKKTITLHSECKELEGKVTIATDAPLQAAELEKKLAEIDRILGKQQHADNNTQQTLLGIISSYCQNNKTIVREIPKTIYSEQKDFLIETNIFQVEGSFSKLTELIYLLEQKYKIGKIASVHFQTKKDNQTNTIALLATIYLQNIKKR